MLSFTLAIKLYLNVLSSLKLKGYHKSIIVFYFDNLRSNLTYLLLSESIYIYF